MAPFQARRRRHGQCDVDACGSRAPVTLLRTAKPLRRKTHCAADSAVQHRRVFSPRVKWLVVLLAFLLPLAFAGFTGHAWEDYFITLRSSRNLVEGHGLVFNPGERVHTFTS